MIEKRILLRADGNSLIGLGHIYRLLALSDILKDKFEILFVTVVSDNNVFYEINNHIKCLLLENDDKFYNLINKSDIVVLDGYQFDTVYQKKCKEKCYKVISIDDIHSYPFVSDIIINPAENINLSIYSTEKYTKIFNGTRYSLLRPVFILEALKKRIVTSTDTLLISFGGSDNDNNTIKLLKEIIGFKIFSKINVIIGISNIHKNEIYNFANNNKQTIFVYQGLNQFELINVMQESDIALVQPSTISYEIGCVGLPMLLYKTDSNQDKILSFLIKENLGIQINQNLSNLKDCILSLKDLYYSNKIVSNQKKFFDGSSSNNLFNLFINL